MFSNGSHDRRQAICILRPKWRATDFLLAEIPEKLLRVCRKTRDSETVRRRVCAARHVRSGRRSTWNWLVGEDAESPCLPAPTLVGVKMRQWRRDASCFVVARLPSVKLQKTRLEECVRETTNYHLRIRWRRRRRRSDDDDDDAEFDDDVVMWTIDTTI